LTGHSGFDRSATYASVSTEEEIGFVIHLQNAVDHLFGLFLGILMFHKAHIKFFYEFGRTYNAGDPKKAKLFY
jgi:hypothetical protein